MKSNRPGFSAFFELSHRIVVDDKKTSKHRRNLLIELEKIQSVSD
jgi:hypothetical protein